MLEEEKQTSTLTNCDAVNDNLKLNATLEDILILARTIYGEARGETPLGQTAVAWVVKRRAILAEKHRRRTGKSHPLFGDGTLSGACHAKWQFSCWNQNDPNRKKILSVGFDNARFCEAVSIAARVHGNLDPDPTQGSIHYHYNKIMPSWVEGKKPIVIIGQHSFYNNIR